ncbi:MAG: EF-P 5-aminopentanol modification-associated protein YfmF [Acetivibrionales bacterium]|mgnify:CR=1 FL=1|nr:insulinase family protein [Clostridiaceae bacterium]
MESSDIKTSAVKIAERDGVNFYRVSSDKFKTSRADVYFVDNLSQERASGNALVPLMMKRGCESYPDFIELETRLEELYGADINAGAVKKGENQIIGFHMSHISDRYANNERLFDSCSDLLMCMLEKPLIDDSGFKKSLFRQERDNLIAFIRSRINDKINFSLTRCIEEMCEGEPYAIPDDGTEEGALLLDPKISMDIYKEMISTYPAYVYFSGDIDDKSIKRFIDNFLSGRRSSIKRIDSTNIKKSITSVKKINEKMDVNQGKLCMGFRTNIEPSSQDYYSLVVYNAILGGSTHSKLFRNVREKESLAYYAQSVLEKYKGLMIIMSGIEATDCIKAEDIMLAQVEEMKKGNISKDDMEASLKSLETGMKSIQDSQGAIVDFFFSQNLTQNDDDFDSLIQKFKSVKIDDVVKVAQNVELDTIYFLEPDGNKEGQI